jgi:hypothetical protein
MIERLFYSCPAQPQGWPDRLNHVIVPPTGQPSRRLLVELLLRALAIAVTLGLILGLLPAMVEASI